MEPIIAFLLFVLVRLVLPLGLLLLVSALVERITRTRLI